MALGRTKILLQANVVGGAVELLLILLALRSGRIELVAAAVVVSYVSAVIVLIPFLRREFSIGLGDITAQIWPVGLALIVGCLVASLLPASMGSTIVTLAGRGLITALGAALTHGLCTRFRCFHEAGGMISQSLARVGA